MGIYNMRGAFTNQHPARITRYQTYNLDLPLLLPTVRRRRRHFDVLLLLMLRRNVAAHAHASVLVLQHDLCIARAILHLHGAAMPFGARALTLWLGCRRGEVGVRDGGSLYVKACICH